MRRLTFCVYATATILTLLRAGVGTAQADQPPSVLAPSSVLASEGIPFQFLVTATDPDGDPILSLTASPLPSGATFTVAAGNTSGTLSWQPTYQQAGLYSILFTAVNTMTGTDTSIIDVGETRTLANQPYAARLECGVSAATGELVLAVPPNPCLGGPMPLGFDVYYASLLGRTARYQSALGENWRGTYDWRLFVSGSTAEVEDHLGALYRFAAVGSAWSLVEPTDLPHQLVAVGSELVFKHGESLFLYFFDTASGRLTKIQDLPGNQHTLAYDSSTGKLAQVSDAFGRAITFSYDRSGRLTGWSDGTRAGILVYSGNLLSSYTDPATKTTSFTYASHPIPGLLTSVQDPTGAVPHQYLYDSAGRVMTVTNAKSASFGLTYVDPEHTDVSNSEGGMNSFTHKLPGRLVRHEDPLGGITTWSYDSKGRVTDTSRAGSVLQVAYDPTSGYPSSITYPGPAQFQFAYVAKSRVPGVIWHRLETQTAPDLTRIQLGYDAVGNVTLVTDEAFQAWRLIRNAQGQPIELTNPSGGVHTFAYDSAGRLGSHTFGPSVTSYTYDALDRLITITQPDLSTRGFQYDLMNRPLTATNELTKTWTMTYRPNGQLASVDDPLSRTVTYAYDNMNWLTSATDEIGNPDSYVYDNLGRLTARTDRSTRTWSYTYDALGRLASSAEPASSATSYGWDARSRLVSVARPLGRTTTYSYDGRDRLTGVIDPLLASTAFTYDDRNHLVQVSAPESHTETYAYDARGLLQSLQIGSTSAHVAYSPLRRPTTYTDGNGQDWHYAYNNRGLLTSRTDPLSRTESFTYDSRDRPAGFTTTLGTASFGWDAAGRMTQRSYSDGTAHAYTYDNVGRLLTTDGVTRTYDALGRLTQENGISFGYDNAGRLTSQSFGSGRTLSYSYNPRGLLSGIADWAGRTTLFQYDAAGRRTTLIRPNGLTTRYVYDAADHLAHWTVAGTESVASASVTHDKLGRVKVRFPWNSAANVTPPVTAGVYSHDAASQIVGFTYDGMGRLLNDGVRSYAWDLASRLTSFTEGGQTTTIRYDGLDRAFESTKGGVVTSLEFGHPSVSASGHEVGHWFGQYYPSSQGGDAGSVGFFQMRLAGVPDGSPPTTGRSADGAWLRVYVPGPAAGGDHEVGHWQGLYHSSGSQSAGMQLYFAGKLKVNGNPMHYTVRDTDGTKDQLLYTIGHLNGAAIHHHVDDLDNVSFLSNDFGSIVTNYGYSPTGELSQLGWTPQAPRYTYRASDPVTEESPGGLYRMGTDLYDTKTGRKLPDRLKHLPPPPEPGSRLYVGNLSMHTSETGSSGPVWGASDLVGSLPSPLELILKGQQVGGPGSHPDFIWLPTSPVSSGALNTWAGNRVQNQYHPTGGYAVQVGWWGRSRHSARYYVTGARHVYMPSGEGFKTTFTLGAEPPTHSGVVTATDVGAISFGN